MDSCEDSLSRLVAYCKAQGWKGYDPYDALNSPIARLLPERAKSARIALTQFVRRSPVNFRPILGIHQDLNPKGLALAARGLLALGRASAEGPASADSALNPKGLDKDFRFIMASLLAARNPAYEEACWGYNFPWQSRAFFAPRGVPNAVCTVFAALAYLDWYDQSNEEFRLNIAASACRFVLDCLNRTEDGEGVCFSYTPLDNARVHNVNLLAAELLARVYRYTGRDEYADAAHQAVEYTLARQRDDGSWRYGESRNQGWIDSFHTGFILISLSGLIRDLGEARWFGNLEAGYNFYKNNLFLADGTPKYYHNRVFPIDSHSASVGVLTFLELAERFPDASALAKKVMTWTMKKLQDPHGFFHYQIHRLYRIRIPYMRWTQAWMLYALASYLERSRVFQNG